MRLIETRRGILLEAKIVSEVLHFSMYTWKSFVALAANLYYLFQYRLLTEIRVERVATKLCSCESPAGSLHFCKQRISSAVILRNSMLDFNSGNLVIAIAVVTGSKASRNSGT